MVLAIVHVKLDICIWMTAIFRHFGAASILTKKVAEWKGEQEDIWDGYHIFEEAKKKVMNCVIVQLMRCAMYLEKELLTFVMSLIQKLLY